MEIQQKRVVRCQALIERYGSEDAALEPCERERMLLEAVKPWRQPFDPPHQRWTRAIGDWDTLNNVLPEHVEKAIRCAYTLPSTVAEARSEYDYWLLRNREIADILNDRYGGFRLDLVAQARMRIVEKLIEAELTVKTPADLVAKCRLYCERRVYDFKIEEKLFCDLERIVSEHDGGCTEN